MGVRNLWDILESCKKTLPLHHLQNKRLCVDLSCWLIQLRRGSRSACWKDTSYLKSLFYRLRALIALNCSLILVTDGAIPCIKLSTYKHRLGQDFKQINHDDKASDSMTSLRRHKGSDFSCMIKEAKDFGLALGIPFLDGIEEAEAQCALLNSESLCDGCFTSDSDIFLFGGRTVYRKIVLGELGYVVCYDMADIEMKLGFGRNSLIALALLLGSDYSQGVFGIGPETACRLVKSVGEVNILQRVKSEGLAFARQTNKVKKKNSSINYNADKENLICYKQHIAENQYKLGPNDHLLQIINAYLEPKCHLADSEAVQRACTTYPFLREKFQKLCAALFGWTTEKADECILPMIAKRDLRRFANLRNISSALGAKIPLHKMPIPCPVTAIVRQRKLQGKDYFEVSWQARDGLQISTAPTDLIESACPEIIAEFMEKKGKGNKERSSCSRKQVDLNKVNTQLQRLLVDIESQSCSNSLHSFDDEIIDLSSPSPPPLLREPADPQLCTVDLCESDDTPPSSSEREKKEHERKARELRLFLESIRGEFIAG